MTCVGGTCRSSLILLERYWLSSALSSPFCCCSSATSSMVLLRAETSALYFCSAFSSAFHTRKVLSLMMLAMRSQNSRSSRRVTSCPASRLAVLTVSPPRCRSAWCSSTKALIALIASLGWMSSWLSASARKYERSFSTSAAPSTPSTLRMESILSRFCSSGGSGSRSFWILPSTRKPASLQSSSSIRLMFSLSICPREIGPPSPSPPSAAPVARCPAAPPWLPAWKMCSEGGNQLRPSCCSCTILSAWRTLRMSSVMPSSFICQTSR
mmetsp:Transcript_61751/g.148747  ORF Transcript_61751/g.148747 Transcript_61751/m.148747 type:complete len:268 (+) Transcript_61751:137-940(+)